MSRATTSVILPIRTPVSNPCIYLLKLLLVQPGTFAEELSDRLDYRLHSSKKPHGRSNRGRIDALLGRVYLEHFDQLIGEVLEQKLIQTLIDNNPPVVSQRPLADVDIRIISDIHRIMPGQVESQLLDYLGIGQIVQLLEDQSRAPSATYKSFVGLPSSRLKTADNFSTSRLLSR